MYLVDQCSNSSMSTTVAGTEVWRRPGTLEIQTRKTQAPNRRKWEPGGAVEDPVTVDQGLASPVKGPGNSQLAVRAQAPGPAGRRKARTRGTESPGT